MGKGRAKGRAKARAKGKARGKTGSQPLMWTLLRIILNLLSLVFLIIVGLGCTNKDDKYLNNLYFMRVNTSNIQQDSGLIVGPAQSQSQSVSEILPDAVTKNVTVPPFYHVGLWSYCHGTLTNKTHFDNQDASKTDIVTHCTKRRFPFWFNPVEVWGLNQTVGQTVYGKELDKALVAYKRTSIWMSVAYVLSIISIVLELLVGLALIKLRRTGLITTLFNACSSILLPAFAIPSLALYSSLVGTFNHLLTNYNIHGTLGVTIYLFAWSAVLCSWLPGIIWMIGSCCCADFLNRMKGYKRPDDDDGNSIPKQYSSRQQNIPFSRDYSYAVQVGSSP